MAYAMEILTLTCSQDVWACCGKFAYRVQIPKQLRDYKIGETPICHVVGPIANSPVTGGKRVAHRWPPNYDEHGLEAAKMAVHGAVFGELGAENASQPVTTFNRSLLVILPAVHEYEDISNVRFYYYFPVKMPSHCLRVDNSSRVDVDKLAAVI